jgi:broad specificity phosphatase PhoE
MAQPVLYYVRHGQTDWNAQRRLQGQLDIPLNPLGREQAVRSGGILRDLFERDRRTAGGFDYVASPLGRARETMELIRGGLGLDPATYRTDPRLKEMSFGRWEGFTFTELQAREAETLAARENDKWGFVVPGGESYAQLVVRVHAWYETIERDTVVAAHGGVARALMAHLGIESEQSASALREIGQGVVYVFEGQRLSRYE